MNLPTDKLSQSSIENITKWLSDPKYLEYKDELQKMIDDQKWQELEDSFFKVIEFGTGGRRGTTGIGSNRINRVTIGESAQALCNYAIKVDEDARDKGIVIGYDARLSSPELSRVAAEVVVANGFKTYMFESFRSTPELSFAVRELGCKAGIVISASHNPPMDNGFKAYWSDGGQVVPPQDKGIVAEIDLIDEIKKIDFDEAIKSEKIILIGKEIDEKYIAATTAEALGNDRDVNIVYSPLHGAGQTNVLPTLRTAGFRNISLVESQMVPDGNFPTIPNGKPNPEELSANDMAVEQMMKESADIAITNDPDADRVCVIVRQGSKPIYLTGNQAAVIATDYALSKLSESGKLTPKHYIVKTIVTTDMLDALAHKYNVKIYGNLLIGFKYIGELLTSKEATDEKFVIGGEESLGLLKGTYARDKDAATGALPIAEYAAELKKSKKTLYDKLLELFKEHGIYVEKLSNLVYPGATGFSKMKDIMNSLQNNPPSKIGDYEVTAVLDYNTLIRRDLKTGETSPIDCIKGNVIVLEFGDHRNRLTIRPSGTEPKIKVYAQWYKLSERDDVEKQYHELEAELDNIIKQLEDTMTNI